MTEMMDMAGGGDSFAALFEKSVENGDFAREGEIISGTVVSVGRDAVVVHPPVDVDYFAAAPRRARRGYVAVGALVPYKRLDLAVRVAVARRLPLTVVGDGPERRRLEQLAGPTVQFIGAVDRVVLRDVFAGAEALLFPGEEDFGIVPIEAMAGPTF